MSGIIELPTPAELATAGIAVHHAIQQAFIDSTIVECAPGASYVIAEMIVIPSGAEFRLNGAKISAATDFTDFHLVKMAGNSVLMGAGTLDGTNLPRPGAGNHYTSGDYPGVPVYIDGDQSFGRIENLLIANAPSGAILTNSSTSPDQFLVRNCGILSCQTVGVAARPLTSTSTPPATSTLIDFYGVAGCRIEGCWARDYNQKGFSFGNSSQCQIISCAASGGANGDASHFITGGSDNAIIDCIHQGSDGVGHPFKIVDSVRPQVLNFSSISGFSGGFVQKCTNFVVDGLNVLNPTKSALYIGGEPGATLSGRINRVVATRAIAGSSQDESGIVINWPNNPQGPINCLSITNCRLDNFYWGIGLGDASVSVVALDIHDNSITNARRYGIEAFVGSGRIARNRINTTGSDVVASIAVASDRVVAGALLRVEDNEVTGALTRSIWVGGGARHTSWSQLRITGNSGRSGTKLIELVAGTAAPLSLAVITDNSGVNYSTSGLDLSFAATRTVLRCEQNEVLNASAALLPNVIANYSAIEIRGSLTYSGSPAGQFNADPGTVYYQTDGTGSANFYVKQSSGWQPK